jgi:uncharacterized membrane protein
MSRAALFTLLLTWCGALLFFRIARTGTVTYVFLIWNLFLAVIPAFAAAQLGRARTRLGQWTCASLWLLFLPNAPYLVTDFVHLRPRPHVPLWYDIALLLSCAATGLLLGYVSVADVQRWVAKRFGVLASWACAAAGLMLSGFAIYLGRFLRWNSWDVIADPKGLLAQIIMRVTHPVAHPRTYGVTAVYGVGLLLGYVALHVLSMTAFRETPPGYTRRRG